jgi:hypothetical protein
VYTTNHKRIAINYFNFVLVSGTAGMSLATVIRMEFAYPGVGILAGDSIQYLCIASAHGVIMVFFMIMPAIFGAFGNFLLPTQLGVHDVAFPRLNSAAFWFLPGGLIMLCQLVCVDRRYQRMNCFNIREIQGILKRKFFTDLVNVSDNRLNTESVLIGMRHKNNMNNILTYDQSLFYNFDLTKTSKFKSFYISPGDTYTYRNHNLTTQLFNNLNLNPIKINLSLFSLPLILPQLLKDFINFLNNSLFFILYPISSISYSVFFVNSVFISNLYLYITPINNTLTSIVNTKPSNTSLNYSSPNNNYLSQSLLHSNLTSDSYSKFSDNSSH